MRGPRLTVDLDAIAHNVAAWLAYLNPAKEPASRLGAKDPGSGRPLRSTAAASRVGARELWAVVKSNAYGCGAVAVARACLDAGAARLVVFDVAEARALRDAGIRAPIVQVFSARGADLAAAIRLGVTPTIEDEAGGSELSTIGSWRGRRFSAHVAIDTGSGWSGVPSLDAGEFARRVANLRGVTWEGAWTHIAGPDSLDAQLRAFATAIANMRAEGLDVPVTHVASTGPALWGRSTGAARIGIGLFGSTLNVRAASILLRTAVTVRADVIAVKRFATATPLGYGGEDVAQPGDVIATVRIGYADGLPKSVGSGAGMFLIGPARYATAGAIGMNTTMLRVPPDAVIRLGDEVTVLGDVAGVRLDDVAAAAGMIPHALLTSLGNGIS